MTDDRFTDDDLLLFVCGELEADRRAELAAAMETDSVLKARADGLARALDAVTPRMRPEPSAEFDSELRGKLDAEASAHCGTRRLSRAWVMFAAAAAIAIAAIVLQVRGRLGGEAGIAWADVAAAMDRIPHFHAVMFFDEQRSSDDVKMFRIDIFYQQPGVWRAQGRGYVQFQRDGGTRLFDVEKRQFADLATTRQRLIPDEFVKQFETDGLLTAVLRTLFRGNVPAGEPVKSAVEATRGIDVFDYASDPMEAWARIWVLRESRLPIHLKVFQPRSDDFALVVFDYSDPQSEGFFDPDAFEKAVKENGLRRPTQIYGAGSEPVGVKPRSSDQIYELSGGYTPGIVQQVVANDLGDLMVAWSHPDNVSPRGGYVREGFENITDSWGNSYLSTGGSMPVEPRVWRMFYTPVPPFKRGEGPRVLSLEYVIHDRVPSKKKHMGDLGRRLVLATPKIEVPAATVAGYPADWQEYISDVKKEQAVRWHVKNTGTLMQQLQYVEKMLDADPLSMDANLWKMKLLRAHGREEEGWELFEKVIKERLLAELPRTMGDGGSRVRGDLLADHAHRLAGEGSIDEIDRLLRLIANAKEKALDEMKKLRPGPADSARRSIEGYFEYSKLSQMMNLSSNLRAFAAAPKPTVERMVSSGDGYVFIELRIPDEPFWRNEYGGLYPQQPACPVKGRRTIHRRFDAATRRYRMLLGGVGDVTSLTFRAVVSDEHPKGAYSPLCVDWTLKLDAKQVDVESMKLWWAANLPGEEWPEVSEYEQAIGDAGELSDKGDYAGAAEAWRRAMAAQPTYVHTRPLMLKCLIKAGQLDAAFAELAKMEADLPAQPDPMNQREIRRRAEGRSVRLEAVRYLMQHARFDEAQKLLDEIERGRPDLAKINNDSVMEERENGHSYWHPRSENARVWREFDEVKWYLEEAHGRTRTSTD